MEHFIFSCLESRLEEGGSLYGRFLLGPFRVGQGITVATALRRTLLSELQGIAITAVEIEGAAHQYSSIGGVQESTLDITLNLKQVVLAGASATELPAVGYINVLGPRKVCASDLRLPTGISCVNGDHHIATVSSNGVLIMKFVMSVGKNYVAHHSPPAQTAKPSLFRPKLRKSVVSSSLPSSAVQDSRVRFVERLKHAEARIDCRSRYSRRIGTKVVLSSGAANDIISYTKERRFTSTGGGPHLANGLIDRVTPDRVLDDSQNLEVVPRSEMQQNRVVGSDSPLTPPRSMATRGLTSLTSRTSRREVREVREVRRGWPSLKRLAGNDAPAVQPPIRLLKRGKTPRTVGSEALSKLLAPTSKESAVGGHATGLAGTARSTSYPLPGRQSIDDRGNFFGGLAKNSDPRSEVVRGDAQAELTRPHPSGGEEIVADLSRTLLPIDAVFMPVNKVNFSLQTDDQWQERRERIVLEVWTNGSVSPRQALHEAATCLVYMFSLFRESQTVKSALPFFKVLSNKGNEHQLSQSLAEAVGASQEAEVFQGPIAVPPWVSGFEGEGGDGLRQVDLRGGGPPPRRSSEGDPGKNGGGQEGPLGREPTSFLRGRSGRVMDVENLDLSVQAYVALKQSRIHTIDDLLTCPSHYLEKAMSGNKLISFEISEKIKELKA